MMKRIGDCVFLLLFVLVRENDSTKNNQIYLDMECFKNPGHLNINGQYCDMFPNGDCDPQFTFCLGTDYQKDCHLFEHISNPFPNMAYICGEKRRELKDPLVIKFPEFLPRVLYLKVTVSDHNMMASFRSKKIAEFAAQFSVTPTLNSQKLQFTAIEMKRLDSRSMNPKASLTMNAAAYCKPNHYGEWCHKECQPNPTHYKCDQKGDKICNPGWRNVENDCQSKDYCLLKGCAPTATCKNNQNNRTCFCNGGKGDECYPNYDHCSKSPCLNQGTCLFDQSNSSFICNCQGRYKGRLCETIIDLCQDNPCENGGKCFSNSQEIICNCPEEFAGPRCELKVHNSYNESAHQFVAPGKTRENVPKQGGMHLIGIIISCGVLSIMFLSVTTYCWISHKRSERQRTSSEIPLQTRTQSTNDDQSGHNVHNILYEDINTYDSAQPGACYLQMRESEITEYENPDLVSPQPVSSYPPDSYDTSNVYVAEERVNSLNFPLRNTSSCTSQPLPPIPVAHNPASINPPQTQQVFVRSIRGREED